MLSIVIKCKGLTSTLFNVYYLDYLILSAYVVAGKLYSEDFSCLIQVEQAYSETI
jgi:hypothetical protein